MENVVKYSRISVTILLVPADHISHTRERIFNNTGNLENVVKYSGISCHTPGLFKTQVYTPAPEYLTISEISDLVSLKNLLAWINLCMYNSSTDTQLPDPSRPPMLSDSPLTESYKKLDIIGPPVYNDPITSTHKG